MEEEAAAVPPPAPGASRLAQLRAWLRHHYHGSSPGAVRFRYAVIVIDLGLIAFFIAAPLIRGSPLFFVADYVSAFVLALDLAARALASDSIRSWSRKPIVWVDVFVLGTLLAPMWLTNLAFLRVLRLWTLLNSDFFWETVGRRYDDTSVEEVARAGATLVTFIFVMTGFVYTLFGRQDGGVADYITALYFTVATLTTTGFGDVTLPGALGKLISVVTMIAGITLFVGLAQAIFRPSKVRFECPQCGLLKHEKDAVHCKACGLMLKIPNDDP